MMASMRLHSLCISSATHWNVCVPWVASAKTDKMGISSMALTTSVEVANKGLISPFSTRISATNSPKDVRTFSTKICASARFETVKNPTRPSLIPTFGKVTLWFVRSANAIKKLAEDMSLGMVTSIGFGVDFVTVQLTTFTPQAESIVSVWVRVAMGSTYCVSPSAKSPASSTALLTWAELTLAVSRLPTSLDGWMVNNCPSWVVKRAPSSVRGSITLFIGRLVRLWSPTNVAVMPRPATTPASKRAVVPLF